MKFKLIATLSLLSLSTTAFSVTFFTKSKKVEEVDAYSTSSLPTTIDLNDTSEANIRSYYSSLNNKTQSERQGNNLLKNLKTILKNGQKYYSYDSGNAIWQIYEIADRDWSKSPASSTTYGTYNSSTNKISNYTYGSSSSKKNNPYIHALYINRNVTNQTTAWDDHQQTQWGINREHVWPKAEGFETEAQGGARGDPMHLMAGNGYANNIHSNYYYGYVNTSSSYTNCGSKYSNLKGNLMGKSKTLGGSTNVFEPQDSDKGDIARAIFYMVARYNYIGGSDSIDSNNPNLALTQSLSDWASSGYDSTTSKKGYMGVMTDLLAWHHADPVDEYEIHRNNLLYTNFTNNRNPFIDFPEWADFIWGSVNYNGSTYVSHSTTPTGYATPSSDTVNGYNSGGGSTVSVTGVSLDKNSATIAVNGTVALTPTVSPDNATNKAVTWTSSNTSVATVSDGVVTGKAAGSATITVTTMDGSYTATCTITVKALSSITVSGQTTSFETGDDFVFGGTVTAHYSDSTTANVTSSASFDGYDLSVAGNQTVTVSYGGKTTTYSITVTQGESTTDSVSISSYATANHWENGTKYLTVNIGSNIIATADGGSNTGKYYTSGNEWRFYQSESAEITITAASGYELDSVTFTYGTTNNGVLEDSSGNEVTSGTKKTVSGSSVTFSVANSGSATNGQVKFTAISVEYHAVPVTVSSIAVKTAPTKTTYSVGDGFDASGLVITVNYSDSSKEDITYKDHEDLFEFDPADDLQSSDTSVTIYYGGKSCSQSITVSSTPTISWTAPTINVFSGTVLSGTDVNGWSVTYNDGAGHQTVLTYNQLTVKLGGTTISIPHIWVAGDDGKKLTATYSSLTTSESSAVVVTQTINSITASVSENYDYIFESKQYSEAGSVNLDGHSWTLAGTGGGYWGYEDARGQQLGSGGNPYSSLSLTCSDFTGTITSVTVYTSGGSSVSATVQVSVGGTPYGDSKGITSSNKGYTFSLGGKSGTVVISWTQSSSKALYVKEIVVRTSGTAVISNSADHIAAQRAVVKFAKAFNAAMDTTSYCTANLSSAWSTCSSAYNTFKTEAAALSSTEEAYAYSLLTNATARYSDNSGEACVERMLKTYEICVQQHGQNAFMSEIISLSRIPLNSLQIVAKNAGSIIAGISVALISVTAIESYFYFRKKKEN